MFEVLQRVRKRVQNGKNGAGRSNIGGVMAI
jgi:hypothetical protein